MEYKLIRFNRWIYSTVRRNTRDILKVERNKKDEKIT